MTRQLADKHAALVDRLWDQTQSKRIDWEIEAFTHKLRARVGDFVIQLEKGSGTDGSPVEVVKIVDPKDQLFSGEIESFTDEELVDLTPRSMAFDSYWKKMEALRIDARRQAVGAEQALDSIMKSLNPEEEDDEF